MNNQKLRLSLAMTAHNSSRFLMEQLCSLRDQELPFDEVIIVDDASDDETPWMIENFIRENHLDGWHLILHPVNEGFVSSFRDALYQVSGDLIFLADHDDVWYPDKTRRMKEQFDEHPELLTLASSFDLIDAQGQSITDKTSSRKANHNLIRRAVKDHGFTWMTFDDILGYNISPGCTLAMRRVLKEQYLQTPPDINLPHDWALCAIAAIENGLGYLDAALMGYRQHEGNTLGLARRTDYASRSKAAWQDSAQKDAIVALAIQFNAPFIAQKKAETTAQFFRQRAVALERRSLFDLSTLLVSGIGSGYRMTIGMDIRTVLSSRQSLQKDEEGSMADDPAAAIKSHASQSEEAARTAEKETEQNEQTQQTEDLQSSEPIRSDPEEAETVSLVIETVDEGIEESDE